MSDELNREGSKGLAGVPNEWHDSNYMKHKKKYQDVPAYWTTRCD